MGTILKLICKNCGETESFSVGNGIKDARLDFVLESFGVDERRLIQRLLADSIDPSMWCVDRKLAYCRHCGKWKVLPVFWVENGDDLDSSEVVYGKCEECGEKAQYFDTDAVLNGQAKLCCPKCGCGDFSVENAGMWD